MKGSLLFNWISQCQPRLTILLLIWGIAYNDSFNIFVLIVSKYLNHHKESFPLRQYLINDPKNLNLKNRHHKEKFLLSDNIYLTIQKIYLTISVSSKKNTDVTNNNSKVHDTWTLKNNIYCNHNHSCKHKQYQQQLLSQLNLQLQSKISNWLYIIPLFLLWQIVHMTQHH